MAFSKMYKHLYIVFLAAIYIPLFSCNRQQSITEDKGPFQTLDKEQFDLIMDKSKLLSSSATFLHEDVKKSFPEGSFVGMEFMGVVQFKINEEYTLMLDLVSPNPDSFRIAPATPTAFEERPTGVILEVNPEIVGFTTSEKEDGIIPGYIRLRLIDKDCKVLYDSKLKKLPKLSFKLEVQH